MARAGLRSQLLLHQLLRPLPPRLLRQCNPTVYAELPTAAIAAGWAPLRNPGPPRLQAAFEPYRPARMRMIQTTTSATTPVVMLPPTKAANLSLPVVVEMVAAGSREGIGVGAIRGL